MKYIVCLLLALTCVNQGFTQKSRKFNGKSRKDFFGGARDYRQLTKDGLQISLGPNFTFTNPAITEYSGTLNGRPVTSEVDPIGRPGAFIEIGAAHYRLKSSRVLAAWYKKRGEKGEIKRIGANLFHRLDWGLGFNYIGGSERTRFETFDPVSGLSSFNETTGTFYNGYLTARVTVDRFTKIADGWHLETGLGFNFLFNALPAPKAPYVETIAPVKFQQDFMAQFHLHVGFTRTIRRGDYLTFGFLVPALGIYEPNKARPTIQWFSSNYWPVQLQVRWIHHFTKKSNGCNTGTPEDRKRNNEYMQNR